MPAPGVARLCPSLPWRKSVETNLIVVALEIADLVAGEGLAHILVLVRAVAAVVAAVAEVL